MRSNSNTPIPPYLSAQYSLIDGKNDSIADIFASIVFQEMQHLALVCNILNAIGGLPEINKPEFIPKYPGGLPFHIGDKNGQSFEVALQPFSTDALDNTFLKIEEPDDPLVFPDVAASLALDEERFSTIGDFYRDLRSILKAEWFTGDPARQISKYVKSITSLADAQAAIDLIVQQGEGTTMSPLEDEGVGLAHYYRFSQIQHKRSLVKDATVKEGYSYSGVLIPFDPTGVYPTLKNPSSNMYAAGSLARAQSDLFNQIYSNLLRALHDAFNGQPAQLGAAVGLMFDLKIQAIKLMQIPLGNGTNAAPCFEYVA